MQKDTLIGKTLSELEKIVSDEKMPRYAAKQIADWLYKKRVQSIDEMTNLSKRFREQLADKYDVGCHVPVKEQVSSDGTIKFLFETGENKYIESVYIPDKERATLCVSSQVGCKMNCVFCMTGKQGFSGNLSAGEIINQIQSIPQSETLTNVVFMGMGEPLDNTEEVLKTIEILTADYGYAWSPKRITLSTIGINKNLEKVLQQTNCHIAISLHNPFHEERLAIMPMEKTNPIQETINVLKQYDFSRQRRVSFEYILFKGKNDSIGHANGLVKLLSGIPCRVNLIRFHRIPDVEMESPDENTMLQFQEYINKHGIICTLRKSRGEDILAACGMLSTKKLRVKN